jgi:ribosomal protein S14
MAEDFNEQTGLPTTNRDQSCAFCGRSRPLFVHRFHLSSIRFRAYGRGRTLPTFWTVCERCEELVINGNDEELLLLMRHQEEDALLRTATLTAFRSADLGASRLRDA